MQIKRLKCEENKKIILVEERQKNMSLILKAREAFLNKIHQAFMDKE